MAVYLLHRVLLMVPTLLGVSIVVFLGIRLIPGDLVVVLSGMRGDVSSEHRAALRRDLGLDRPIAVQYVDWLGAVARGDLGNSLKTDRPIGQDLARRLPVTLELAALAALVGMAIGIPAGLVAALRHGTRTEFVAQGVGLVGLSVPDFWLGTMLLLVASRSFGWYPGARYVSLVDAPGENLSLFVLPAFAVGIGLAASLMRFTRSALLDVLGSGYVVTARAKGLRASAVLWRHAVKNALIPVVTVIGLQLSYLFGGVVVVETVFSLPGLGRFTVEAIADRDYPVVQAAVLLITLLVLATNLAVDVLYAVIDPRIKYGEAA